MNRYLTTYRLETDEIGVFTEKDDYKTAVYNASDWVWQYAETPEQAKKQHFAKLDEYEADPTKNTY